MFGSEVRDRVYRGEDATFTSKGEIGRAAPADHGVRPLIGKFSALNLSRLTPKQRQLFVEQMKYELTLPPDQLNDYLSQRYSPEDEAAAWAIVTKKSRRRKAKLGISTTHLKEKKRQISLKAKRVQRTPEEWAAIAAKRKATLERNKQDPNYLSYGTLKKEHLRRQKLLADRHEARLKEATALFVQPTVAREVRKRTFKLELENQQLKEYLRQNGLPLPGTSAAKKRREELRHGED
jgi:hypothetical protein